MDQRFRTDQSLEEIWNFHSPVLAQNEARFNLILGILERQKKSEGAISFYSFPRAGALAVQNPGRNLVLGDLNKGEAIHLAECLSPEIPGVVGAGDTATWYVEKAKRKFPSLIKQRIYEIKKPGNHPKVIGSARPLLPADQELFVKWIRAFHDEATPHDPELTKEEIIKMMERIFFVWERDGRVRGLAGIVRETPTGSVVGPVYVPPEERGHCYGEAVTAAITDHIFTHGKKSASLYTDASNPVSNKIYERIGYQFVCESNAYR